MLARRQGAKRITAPRAHQPGYDLRVECGTARSDRRKVSRKLSTFVLLGIALSHSRAIPRILAVLLAVAQPLDFTAFVVLQNTYLDVAAAWLTAIGFGAAGLSLPRSSSRGNAR
jgi:hypothetical protein